MRWSPPVFALMIALLTPATLPAQRAKPRATLEGLNAELIEALAFSPDGKWLAVGSGLEGENGGEVCIWDVEKAKLKTVLKGHDVFVTSLAFTKDGKTLAVGTDIKDDRS